MNDFDDQPVVNARELPPRSSQPSDPASVRRRAMQSLVDTMDDPMQTPGARKAAAETLLKEIGEEERVNPTVDEMSDAELIQVILDWRATPQNPMSPGESVAQSTLVPAGTMPVPRGTLAERLAAQLAGVADNPVLDPLCQ